RIRRLVIQDEQLVISDWSAAEDRVVSTAGVLQCTFGVLCATARAVALSLGFIGRGFRLLQCVLRSLEILARSLQLLERPLRLSCRPHGFEFLAAGSLFGFSQRFCRLRALPFRLRRFRPVLRRARFSM